MLAADEKKAFEMMMAEIDSDDNSDDQENYTKNQAKVDMSESKSKYGDDRSSAKTSPRRDQYSGSLNNRTAETKPTGNRDRSTASSNTNTYKRTKEEEEIDNFGKESFQQGSNFSNGPSGNDIYSDVSISKRWLNKVCSHSERNTVKCFIEREKGTMGFQPTIYRCYLEVQNGDSQVSDIIDGDDRPIGRFMMSAKKKFVKKNSSSYYLVSVDMDPSDDRGSESVMGKLRGNSVGNHYLITDHGLAPGKTVAPSMLRKEFGVVGFEFDSGGPSKIECFVPYVSQAGLVSVWQPEEEGSGLERRVEQLQAGDAVRQHWDRQGGDDGKLFLLRNKEPKWDETHGGHVLNFQGRVTESSVKNFQLVCQSVHSVDGTELNSRDAQLVDPEEIVLQFGRIGKNRFTMDFKFPLSPLQAFSICVACLDVKIADRKGYEYFQKMRGGTTELVGWAANRLINGREAVSGEDENDDDTARGSRDNAIGATGSVNGSQSMIGQVQEVLPSGKYIKDKINRTFK